MEKTTNIKPRAIHEIVRDIYDDWKEPYFGAKPYMQAMLNLNSINDMYDLDSAVSIVRYFLANASTWRGPVARMIKQELKNLLKQH